RPGDAFGIACRGGAGGPVGGVRGAPVWPPGGGAALLAARRAGWDPDAAWIARLGKGLTDAGLFVPALS
ncbi:MAG: hypothetical protein ABF893_05725, partial [Gluconacetobacter liquefaciens]